MDCSKTDHEHVTGEQNLPYGNDSPKRIKLHIVAGGADIRMFWVLVSWAVRSRWHKQSRCPCTIVVGEFDMFGEFDNREFFPHF